MRVAIRRTLRVGSRNGAPLEDLGVVPDERHYLTKNDIMKANVDLLNKAGAMLAKLPKRDLQVEVETSPTEVRLRVTASGMNRLDIYRNDQPVQSLPLNLGKAEYTVAKQSGDPTAIDIKGFEGRALVARYRLSLRAGD